MALLMQKPDATDSPIQGMAAPLVQHPMHAMVTPIVGRPSLASMVPPPDTDTPPPQMSQSDIDGMSGGGGMAAMPQSKQPIVRTMTPSERIEDHLNQKLMADYEKDANPYGSANNHPGFFGKVLHGLSVATGGPGRREFEEQGGTTRSGHQVVGLENKIQGIESQQSQQAFQGANTAHLNAETPEIAPNAESERELQTAQAGNLDSETTERAQTAAQGPSLANAYAHAVNQAITAGRDPAQDPIVQHLSDAITALQPQQNNTQEAPKTIQVQVGGKPHQMAWNPQSRKYDLDQGESGEKPPTIKVGSGDAELDRTGSRFGKPYESAVSSANTQLEKIADARAMINGNAEAQALGVPKVLTALVSGQGSGVRITQAELNMIAHARGIQGDFEGWMNKVSGKGALTDEQKRQLSGVLDDAKQRIIVKQQIANDTLDRMNGAPTRQEIIQADKDARQKLSEYEQHGFYTGQHIPQGTVVGFSADGKVRIDDAR